MGITRRTWTAALAAAAIGATGIGVAAASGPAGEDRPERPVSTSSSVGNPATSTSAATDDGTADQGPGDRPAGSATSTTAGDNDDGTADQGPGDDGHSGDDRSGHGSDDPAGDDHGSDD
jgi:hypothetical protein